MKRVLIVEPDRALAGTLYQFFSRTHDVVVAFDSQDAITAADENSPDAVILELAIAEHNGIAFLQEFRSYPDWAKIPVIIYSRIPREDTELEKHEWHKYGVTEFLYKPTATLAVLAKAVDEAA